MSTLSSYPPCSKGPMLSSTLRASIVTFPRQDPPIPPPHRAHTLQPARMASPVSPRSALPPVAAPPTMEEMWAEYDRHLEEMVPPEVKSKQLAKKEEAE